MFAQCLPVQYAEWAVLSYVCPEWPCVCGFSCTKLFSCMSWSGRPTRPDLTTRRPDDPKYFGYNVFITWFFDRRDLLFDASHARARARFVHSQCCTLCCNFVLCLRYVCPTVHC